MIYKERTIRHFIQNHIKFATYDTYSYEDYEIINQMAVKLDERERLMIYLRFYKEATFQQMGKSIGVTGSRANQIYEKAIRKMIYQRTRIFPGFTKKEAKQMCLTERWRP